LSIGLGALVNAGLLLVGLLRNGAYRPAPGWALFALRVALATVALGAGLAWASEAIDWIAMRSQWGLRAGAMAAVLAGSALGYFAILFALGVRRHDFVRRSP
jgi:putative peptidoglycan lipid II flippase